MHEKVECTECHVKLVFTNVGTKCADCHADIHRRQFGANCEQCHTVQGWNVSVQAIQNHQNRFPLIGAHAAVDCDACHTGAAAGQFQGLSTQCYSCHAQDFQSVTTPNHVASQFSTNCQTCHNVNTWLNATFNHSLTGFPLTGAHVTVACASCHVNNNYNLTAANTACSACHLADFQSTTNPNSRQGGFSTTCQTVPQHHCLDHATFDHNATGFPLTGAHVTVACTSCHVNNNYNLTAANAACSACHMTDFQRTTNPNHVQSDFPHDLPDLPQHHSVDGRHVRPQHHGLPADRRARERGLRVVPREQQLQLDRHERGLLGCHLTDFQSTTNPNHVQSGIPNTCQDLPHTRRPGTARRSTTAPPAFR